MRTPPDQLFSEHDAGREFVNVRTEPHEEHRSPMLVFALVVLMFLAVLAGVVALAR